MKSFLQDYFYYSRAERNGALTLLLLCAGLFLLPRLYPHFVRQPEEDFGQYQKELQAFWEGAGDEKEAEAVAGALLFAFDPNTLSRDSFLLLGLPERTVNTIIKYREKVSPFYDAESLRRIYTLSDADYRRLAPYVRIGNPPSGAPAAVKGPQAAEGPAGPVLNPFPFDPNTAGEEELLRLGLPEQLAHNILKYREKGGRFRQPEALRKIYGMQEDIYQAIAPFIEIEDTSPALAKAVKQAEASPRPFEHIAPPPAIIDVNQANEEEWQQLKGIGPGYARRITRFRDQLGGFASIGQVGETYGLPDSVFQQLRPQLRLSPVFRKLDINAADAETLQSHPYLNWRQANAIVNYRAQHGPFRNVEELYKVKALPEEVVEKISPYVDGVME